MVNQARGIDPRVADAPSFFRPERPFSWPEQYLRQALHRPNHPLRMARSIFANLA
jgi:hypothetical protein